MTLEAARCQDEPDVILGTKSKRWSKNKKWAYLVGGFCLGVGLSAIVFTMVLKYHKYYPITSKSKESNLREKYVQRNDEIKERIFELEEETSSSICRTNECIDTASSLLKSINFTVDPCDDFYEFACGRWNKDNPDTSHFRNLRHTTNKMTRKILSSPKNEDDPRALNLAKDFYASCIDIEELDRVGLEPLIKVLEDYGGWPILYKEGTWNSSNFDWMRSIADLKRVFSIPAIYDIIVNQNTEQNKSLNTVHLKEPSLFLPRPFLVDPEKYPKHIAAYKSFVTNIVLEMIHAQSGAENNITEDENITSRVNISYIESQAENFMQFEAYVAYFTREPQDEFYLKNTSITAPLNLLQNLFDEFPAENATVKKISFNRLLERLFLSSGVNITESQLVSMSNFKYISTIVSLLYVTSEETLANYLHFRIAASLVSGTTSKMRNHVSEYDKIVSGPVSKTEREYTCASSAQKKFGLAIGYKYMQNNLLSREVKMEVEKFFEEIRSSFKVLHAVTVDWMDEEAHNSTTRKVEDAKSCVAFPDWIGNKTAVESHYTALEFESNLSYLQQLLTILQWQEDTKLKNLKEVFDPGCFWTFPAEIQAYYNHGRETVGTPSRVMEACILNYGGLGTIIGHEITHGLFYEKGWIQDSSGSFTNKSQCLIDQYNEFLVPEISSNTTLNGQLTLDENFPDNGGLQQSYSAFLEYLNGHGPEQKLPGLEQYDSTQLFFISFAHNWCSSTGKESLLQQILTDHHSPDEFRVLGTLRNFDEFAKSWNCPIGSKMNPENANRCSIF